MERSQLAPDIDHRQMLSALGSTVSKRAYLGITDIYASRRRRVVAGSKGRCLCRAGEGRTRGQPERHTRTPAGPCDGVETSPQPPIDGETDVGKTIILNIIYYIKLQLPFVCLSVYPIFFRHDRRTATKFGTHIRVDMGLILS